jgi:hypothetical protein
MAAVAPLRPVVITICYKKEGYSQKFNFASDKHLIEFLIGGRHESCVYHTFDDVHYFYCRQKDLIRIFSDFTSFYLEKKKEVVEYPGKTTFLCNLLLVAENQPYDTAVSATVLELPKNLEKFVKKLDSLPKFRELPRGVEKKISLELIFTSRNEADQNLDFVLYYDKEGNCIIIAIRGFLCVLGNYCDVHCTLQNILEETFNLSIDCARPRIDESVEQDRFEQFYEQLNTPIGELPVAIDVIVETPQY